MGSHTKKSDKRFAPMLHIIALWRYVENERNYPGYHLTADEIGCQILKDQISSVLDGRSTAEIALSPPTQSMLNVPANRRGEARCTYFSALSLRRSEATGEFRITESGGRCELLASRDFMAQLHAGVEDIGHGRGDYSIGDNNAQRLWFWWFPSRPRAQALATCHEEI